MNAACEKMKPYAGLFLRLGLGAVFTYHGFAKVFGPEAALGTAWNSHGGMPVIMQLLVSWGEFLAGLGFLTGVLTCYASLGIIIIMGGAILTVHGKNGFGLQHGGFEYCFVLIMMSLALILTGPGPYTFFKKKSASE